MGLPRTTPKQMTRAVCDTLEASYTMMNQTLTTSINMVEDTNKITINTSRKNYSRPYKTEEAVSTFENEKQQPRKSELSPMTVTAQKQRVLIIGDEKCRNLRASLQKLIGDKFYVTATIYPEASIKYILDNEREALKTFTNNDYVIFFGCTNDKNPFEVMSYLNFWIMSNTHTNLIIPEVPYSRFLNRSKLNYEIKFVCARP